MRSKASKAAYPWFYFFRISRLSLIVFLPTLIFVLALYRSSYKQGLIEQMTFQVREDLANTKHTLEKAGLDPMEWCRALPGRDDVRYSLIDRQGISRCDTFTEKVGTKIEDLSEVIEARATGFSSAVRFSEFFTTDSLFSAQRLNSSLVLRKVIPISSLKDNLNRFDRQLFFKIVPLALFSYLLFIYLFYEATRPLGVILSKVEKFQVDVPFTKTIRLLYRKDKWAQIEEALNEADQKFKDQVNQTKLENEKITTILESIRDNIIAVDNFETIMFYNTNFNKDFIRGRTSGGILLKLWHIFDDQEILDAFRSVLSSGNAQSIKGPKLLPNRYFDLTVTPLKDVSGRVIGALGVFYDVTEFKLTEKMRVDFVANVSHEIRTPLTSIKGYTQVLQGQSSKISEELLPFLDKISTNTERMISLFNDLLNLSVIESKFELKKEDINLPDLIEGITESIGTSYPEKTIAFSYDLKLTKLYCDQKLMEQVISNLIDNACKYAGNDLEVKISSYERNGRAHVAISDTGPGISQEHLQRIFERFYRVDSSREISRGTGLGLSIVKHIVSRHGGKIWAESEGGRGTTFFIELPMKLS